VWLFFHLARLAAMAVMGLQNLNPFPPPVLSSQYDRGMIKGMTCKAWEPTVDRPSWGMPSQSRRVTKQQTF